MLGENKAREGFIKGLEGEKFWKRIFDSINDGISIIDRDFNVISVNSTMERWHGEMLPLVGRKCYHVYHGRSKPCEYCPALVSMKEKRLTLTSSPVKALWWDGRKSIRSPFWMIMEMSGGPFIIYGI
ncbi:PAS domain-containing protein [Methanocella conradii]|uniref:PAS domain-containing protein n=1 Tax=Methanocella conradii TaxID=1175444 RepID=UPI00157C06E2|nr:PAS domain-containing protein [Methanocella conradii]